MAVNALLADAIANSVSGVIGALVSMSRTP